MKLNFPGLLKFRGLTTSLLTPMEYEKASIKHKALTLALMYTFMLFFMANPKDHVNSTSSENQKLVHAAGYSVMVYAAMSSTDGLLRLQFPGLRIFDELAILAAYTSLSRVIGLVFEEAFIYYGAAFAILMVSSGSQVLMLKYGQGPSPSDLKEKSTKDIIAAVASIDSPAAANAITTMALFAIVNKPRDPSTVALVEAALKVIKAPVAA